MAILQISRIQVRRGLQENLPQLASAELGWAIDTRRLFIGNGLLTEGAPTEGVTELLTQYSNLTTLAQTYTYAGDVAGHTVDTTGNLSLAPVSRSIANKLDDITNLRDFYRDAPLTLGDGLLHGPSSPTHDSIENPVDTINRMIDELYQESAQFFLGNDPREKRLVRIPAGVYLLYGDFIRLFPNVKLLGEGKNSTIIIQMDPAQPCAISSCDSNRVTGFAYAASPESGGYTPGTLIGSAVIGAATTVLPGKLEVEGITFINATNKDVAYFDSVTDVLFNKVALLGNAAITSSNASVKIGAVTSGSQTLSSRIVFNDCDFAGLHYALYADNNVTKVDINGGSLTGLNNGVMLGLGNATPAVSSVSVKGALFDQIANAAIQSYNVNHVVSAFNTYETVGVTGNTSVINVSGINCYSIGDSFNRAFNSIVPTVNINGKGSYAITENGNVLAGTLLTSPGNNISIAANTAVTGNAVVGFNELATIVEYAISRTPNQRIGSMKISNDGTSITYEDDYIQSNDTGVTLTPSINGGLVELQYTVTSGAAATVKLSSRTLL